MSLSLVDYQSSSGEESDVGETDCESKKVPEDPPEAAIKVKKPVKIAVPSLASFEEEDDASPAKKTKLQKASGLLNMLPPPKFFGSGGKTTLLVPHVLKKQVTEAKKCESTDKLPISSPVGNFVNDTKVPADLPKSEADSIVSKEAADEVSSSTDYFSLESKPSDPIIDIASIPLPAYESRTKLYTSCVQSSTDVTSSDVSAPHSYPSSEQYASRPQSSSDVTTTNMPHSYNSVEQYASCTQSSTDVTASAVGTPHTYGASEISGAHSESYSLPLSHSETTYSSYPESHYESSNEPSVHSDASSTDDFMNDEGFLRLQGKKMRKMEDVNIIDISGDSLLADKTQWHVKSLTEEKKVTHSRKKGDMPTHVQRRKHQITYLAFQAKERELDLKNQWSQNRLTKQQTQAKYGF